MLAQCIQFKIFNDVNTSNNLLMMLYFPKCPKPASPLPLTVRETNKIFLLQQISPVYALIFRPYSIPFMGL